jgi:hypothetical protein
MLLGWSACPVEDVGERCVEPSLRPPTGFSSGAWPGSRRISMLATCSASQSRTLTLRCTGYRSTIGWIFQSNWRDQALRVGDEHRAGGACPVRAQPLPTLESERRPVWSSHKMIDLSLTVGLDRRVLLGHPPGDRLGVLLVGAADRRRRTALTHIETARGDTPGTVDTAACVCPAWTAATARRRRSSCAAEKADTHPAP